MSNANQTPTNPTPNGTPTATATSPGAKPAGTKSKKQTLESLLQSMMPANQRIQRLTKRVKAVSTELAGREGFLYVMGGPYGANGALGIGVYVSTPAAAQAIRNDLTDKHNGWQVTYFVRQTF
jgi:hypothetical protein